MASSKALRADAVPVYRYLRDHGPDTLSGIADAAFPLTFGRDDPLYKRLHKRSVTRVLNALQWLRGEGVPVYFVSGGLGTTITLLKEHPDPSALVPFTVPRVRAAVPLGDAPTEGVEEVEEGFGREAMGLYHSG